MRNTHAELMEFSAQFSTNNEKGMEGMRRQRKAKIKALAANNDSYFRLCHFIGNSHV